MSNLSLKWTVGGGSCYAVIYNEDQTQTWNGTALVDINGDTNFGDLYAPDGSIVQLNELSFGDSPSGHYSCAAARSAGKPVAVGRLLRSRQLWHNL